MDIKTAKKSNLFSTIFSEMDRIQNVVSIIKEKLGDSFAYAIIIGSSVNKPSKIPSDIDLWIGVKGEGSLSKYESIVRKIVNSLPKKLCIGFTGERPTSSKKIPVEVSVQERTPEEFGGGGEFPLTEPQIFYPFILVEGNQKTYDSRIILVLKKFLLNEGLHAIEKIQEGLLRDVEENVLKIHRKWWNKIKNAAIRSVNIL